MDAKPSVTTQHTVSYKQIREDFLQQMGSLQRKRKTEIAFENMRLYKNIQAIQEQPSITRKKYDPEATLHGSMRQANHSTTGHSMRKLGDYDSGQLPQPIREEKERINRQNAKFQSQLRTVRSNIPMNKAVRKVQGEHMDNYRRFASKYNGTTPRRDPLVVKKLQEVQDLSPGRNMQSMANLSQFSQDNISVEYNEGSVVAKRQSLLKKGHFTRKSQSVSRTMSGQHKNQGSVSKKMLRNNSADLTEVFNQSEQHTNMIIQERDFNRIDDTKTGAQDAIHSNEYTPNLNHLNKESPILQQNPSGLSLESSSNQKIPGALFESILSKKYTNHHERSFAKEQSTSKKSQKSPTLLRAVDSKILQALNSQAPKDRLKMKHASCRNAAMDLSDLIVRLEDSVR